MNPSFKWWADNWIIKDGAYTYKDVFLWVYANHVWSKLDDNPRDLALENELLDMLEYGDMLSRLMALRGISFLVMDSKWSSESRKRFYISLHDIMNYNGHIFDVDGLTDYGIVWSNENLEGFINTCQQYINDIHNWRKKLFTLKNIDKFRSRFKRKDNTQLKDNRSIWLDIVNQMEKSNKKSIMRSQIAKQKRR